MPDLTPANVIERLKWRYAVKRFNTQRKLEPEVWQALEQGLVLTPSSFGMQPWKFIVITDEATKARLSPLSWNQSQPRECSHMVVFAARKSLDEAYVDRFMQSVADGRGTPRETLGGYQKVIMDSVRKSEGHHLEWNTRQVYIALGQLMTTAAMLGVDTCPMEGIEPKGYDELLGLSDSEYTTVVACAVGYRDEEDRYATAPKIRFAASDVVAYFD